MMRVALVAALLCGLLVPAQASEDHGGNVGDYFGFNVRSWSGPREPIARACFSACAMRLAGKFCVRRDGVFHVHASVTIRNRLVVPPVANIVRQVVPACFRRLADRRDAWRSLAYTPIPARDVIAACPALSVCG
jgi:hypothetical protein